MEKKFQALNEDNEQQLMRKLWTAQAVNVDERSRISSKLLEEIEMHARETAHGGNQKTQAVEEYQ